MKLFIATVLCAALSAEACGRSPRIVYERCVSSGDPHYTPVHGKRQKFTRMGEGEFTLAALPAYAKNGIDVARYLNCDEVDAGRHVNFCCALIEGLRDDRP